MTETARELQLLGLAAVSHQWDRARAAGLLGAFYTDAVLSLPEVQGWGGSRRDLSVRIWVPAREDLELLVREPTKWLELGVAAGVVHDVRVGNPILDTRFMVQSARPELARALLGGRGVHGLLHPQTVWIALGPEEGGSLAQLEFHLQAVQLRKLEELWSSIRVIASRLEEFLEADHAMDRAQYLEAVLERAAEPCRPALREELDTLRPPEPDAEPEPESELEPESQPEPEPEPEADIDVDIDVLVDSVLNADPETAAESYRRLVSVDAREALRLKERAKELLRSGLSESAERGVRAGLAALATSAVLPRS